MATHTKYNWPQMLRDGGWRTKPLIHETCSNCKGKSWVYALSYDDIQIPCGLCKGTGHTTVGSRYWPTYYRRRRRYHQEISHMQTEPAWQLFERTSKTKNTFITEGNLEICLQAAEIRSK